MFIKLFTIKRVDTLDRDDLATVIAYAKGDISLAPKVEEIYFDYLPLLGLEGHVALRYLSEVFSPTPNRIVKHQSRKELLAELLD